MRYLFRVSVLCSALSGLGCDGYRTGPSSPIAPAATPTVAPAPPQFPTISVGETVRFQFAADDPHCVGAGGRCRSYNVTAPSDGHLEVVLKSLSGDGSFVATTEMYVVPGGDWWDVGPGPRISVTVRVRAGFVYEIRMYSATVPSMELELRASLQ